MHPIRFLATTATVLLLSHLATTGACAEEQYLMNGKPVSKSMYEACLLLSQGLKQLHANDNGNAVESFKQAADLAPDFAEVQHNLGIALAKTGKPKQAIQHLEKAMSLKPTLAATWLSLAGLYQTEGRLMDAINTYTKFLERFPKDPNATKVKSLVKGLRSESKLAEKTGDLDPEKAASTTDYVKEVTVQGVVRWSSDKMPLKVFIDDGSGTSGYRPSFAKLLKKSFQDWQKASAGLVTFKFVDSKDDSDIQCSWTNDPKRFKNIAEAGETRLYSSKAAGLVRGTIKFLTVPLMKELPLTDNRMRTICLHEIGHVLGMAGHTTNPKDAMFYSVGVSDEWRDLTDRDAATIVRLYSETRAEPISFKQEQ